MVSPRHHSTLVFFPLGLIRSNQALMEKLSSTVGNSRRIDWRDSTAMMVPEESMHVCHLLEIVTCPERQGNLPRH